MGTEQINDNVFETALDLKQGQNQEFSVHPEQGNESKTSIPVILNLDLI